MHRAKFSYGSERKYFQQATSQGPHALSGGGAPASHHARPRGSPPLDWNRAVPGCSHSKTWPSPKRNAGCVSLSESPLSPPGCPFPPEDVLHASVEYSPSHTTPALLMCRFHTQAVNQPLIQKVPRKTVSMGSTQQHRGLSGCLLRRHPIWAPDRVPVAPVLIHLLVNTAGKATEGSPSAWVPCHSHGKPR